MSKLNKGLLVFLAVQLAIVAYVYRPGQDAPPPPAAFFEGVGPEAVRRLAIADDEQHAIVLEKTDKGWVIMSAGNFPVDQEKINSLLAKLTNLKTSRLVTRTRSSHKRLKVGKQTFSRRLELGLENGDSHTLYLGSAPNYKTIHVRADKAGEVYLVKDLASWEAPVEEASWWPTHYMQLKAADLKGVKLTNKHGVLTLHRNEAGQWRLADAADKETLSEDALMFLDKISEITVAEYLGRQDKKGYRMRNPAAVLELTTGKQGMILTVGRKDKDTGDHVLKFSESPFYVRVGAHEVQEFLEIEQGDLLTALKKDVR